MTDWFASQWLQNWCWIAEPWVTTIFQAVSWMQRVRKCGPCSEKCHNLMEKTDTIKKKYQKVPGLKKSAHTGSIHVKRKASNPGAPETAAHLQKPEGRTELILSHSPRQEPVLPMPWSWTSSLQNCEMINFCCLSQLFVLLCMAALENECTPRPLLPFPEFQVRLSTDPWPACFSLFVSVSCQCYWIHLWGLRIKLPKFAGYDLQVFEFIHYKA